MGIACDGGLGRYYDRRIVMKPKLLMFLAAVSLAAASCAKEDCAECGNGSGSVAVAFGSALQSRAFFDGSPGGEAWEREIVSATAVLCDRQGNPAVIHTLNETEIAVGKVLFPISGRAAGESYPVYLFANFSGEVPDDGLSLQNMADSPASKYNGEYEQMRQECIAPGGFAMAARGTITTGHTLSNPLRLTLERTVSKVELKLLVGDGMYEEYPDAEFVVTGTTVDNAVKSAPFFGPATPSETIPISQCPFEQQRGREYRNVFYLFPDGGATQATRMTVSGRFYPQGVESAPNDYREVSYEITPEWAGGDRIEPNTYYRLQAVVNSRTGIELRTTCTITYHPNGGYGGNEEEVEVGTSWYLPDDMSASVYNYGGYIFSAWNTEPDGSGEWYYAHSPITVTGDMVLYAQWNWMEPMNEVYYYSEGFMGSYVEGMMGTGEYRIQDPYWIGYVRQGYMFSHWIGDDGLTYYPGDWITLYTSCSFYAVWERIYDVTYHPNGASGDMWKDSSWGMPQYFIQDLMWIGFSYPGHRFTGWNTEPDGSGTAYAPLSEVVLTDDLQLYAQWSEITNP